MIIAVYWTLKKWEVNDFFLKRQKFLWTDAVNCYGLIQGEVYPYWYFINKKNWKKLKKILLEVELYEVWIECITQADKLEFMDDYQRIQVKTIQNKEVRIYHNEIWFQEFDMCSLKKKKNKRYSWSAKNIK